MNKLLKYIFIGLLSLCTLLICAGYYMLGYALQPNDLVKRSRNLASSLEVMTDKYPHIAYWIDSLQQVQALRDYQLTNDQGEELHALYVRAAQPTLKTAVIVHGYTDNAVRMLHIGYLYSHIMGYNILLPDLHGHGMSGGTEVQMGWKDRLDVLQWTATADELFGRAVDSLGQAHSQSTQMVVHGISMGAATTMMVSGEVEQGIHQQPFIKCFVEDCGYTSAWDEFKGELKAQFGLPAFPLLHTASWLCQLEYGWSFQEASALEQVRKCTRPMLFIHGDADTFVPTWMVYPLYEAKPAPKELWIAPGTAHAEAYKDYPVEYTEKVKNFVEKYIQ